MRIDLHCHSNASDGTESPATVVRRARAAGLDVVALTDHDTLAGLPEAAANLPDGLALVPGCELSCRTRGGVEMHLLGYLFDAAEDEFAREREAVRTDRFRRARAMVDKLRELGAPVTHDQVDRLAAGGAVGRPHVARALVESGVVETVADAFSDEWIGSTGRAYVEKRSFDPARAIALVKRAGGVTVFAHPGAVKRGRVVGEDVIVDLAEAGLDGIEVDHPDHDPDTRDRLRALARDLGLVVTGSSDDHGEITGHRLGANTTDPAAWEALRARATGANVLSR